MAATLAPSRHAVRLDFHPTLIAGVLIRVRGWSGIPVELRDHAHRVVPEGSRGEWWTVGMFRLPGQHRLTFLVAKRMPGGVMAYGTEEK